MPSRCTEMVTLGGICLHTLFYLDRLSYPSFISSVLGAFDDTRGAYI